MCGLVRPKYRFSRFSRFPRFPRFFRYAQGATTVEFYRLSLCIPIFRLLSCVALIREIFFSMLAILPQYVLVLVCVVAV